MFSYVQFYPSGALIHRGIYTSGLLDYPELEFNQTADMKVVFLGISPDYIDEGFFKSWISKSAEQFAHPNTIKWNLSVSVSFQDFPQPVMSALEDNSYNFEGTTYYNVTLLDTLLSQEECLAVPKRGYLVVYMWIPDGSVNHSWFYLPEETDFPLGSTVSIDGYSVRPWAFPNCFGGTRRVVYFDVSDRLEGWSGGISLTDHVARLFNNALEDLFASLLSDFDSRWASAATQRYEQYEVRVLWLNGTARLCLTQIKESYEDLMPWTNWTMKVSEKPMSAELNELIRSKTVRLPTPLNYTVSYSNGTGTSIQSLWKVVWDWRENDPINSYLFDQVIDYFNLTGVEDQSIIPVVFLQLSNDTSFGEGMGSGVSWFPHNLVIMGFQRGTFSVLRATNLITHEIGHWMSLSHHSERLKPICSMSAYTSRFCAFCKDARRRMSFISYYRAATELLSNETLNTYGSIGRIMSLREELEDSLELFYDWEYANATLSIVSVHHHAEAAIEEAKVLRIAETIVILAVPVTVAVSAVVGVVGVGKKRMKEAELVKETADGSHCK